MVLSNMSMECLLEVTFKLNFFQILMLGLLAHQKIVLIQLYQNWESKFNWTSIAEKMVGNVSWITKFNIRCFQSKFFTVFQAMNHILNNSGFHLLLSKIRTKLVVPINSIIEIKKMIYLKRTLLASERVTGPLNNVR